MDGQNGGSDRPNILGEVKIKLRGQSYVLRPTWQNLCKLEDALEKSMLEIWRELRSTEARLYLIATVIWSGLLRVVSTTDEHVEQLSVEEIGEALVADCALGDARLWAAQFINAPYEAVSHNEVKKKPRTSTRRKPRRPGAAT